MYPRQCAEPVDHASRAARRLSAVATSHSLCRIHAGAESAQWRFPRLRVLRQYGSTLRKGSFVQQDRLTVFRTFSLYAPRVLKWVKLNLRQGDEATMRILDRLFGTKKAPTAQPAQPAVPAERPRPLRASLQSLPSLPQVKNSFDVGYAAYGGYNPKPLRTRTSSEVMTRIGELSGWSALRQGEGEYFLVSKRGNNLVYEVYRVGENQYVMLKVSSGEDGYREDA